MHTCWMLFFWIPVDPLPIPSKIGKALFNWKELSLLFQLFTSKQLKKITKYAHLPFLKAQWILDVFFVFGDTRSY